MRVALLLLATLALPGASPACAETRVSRSGDAVHLEANDATINEVLAALGGVRYRNSIALERRVSGVYVGPVDRVVSRLLQGSDFVIKKLPDGVEIIMIGESGATAIQGRNSGVPFVAGAHMPPAYSGPLPPGYGPPAGRGTGPVAAQRRP